MKNRLDSCCITSPKDNEILFHSLFWAVWDEKINFSITKVAEIFRSWSLNPKEIDFMKWYCRMSPSELIETSTYIKSLNTTLFSLVETRNLDVAKILSYLWPRVLAERFWELMVFWVWYNCIEFKFDYDELMGLFKTYFINDSKFVWSLFNYHLLCLSISALKFHHNKAKSLEILYLYKFLLDVKDWIWSINLVDYGLSTDFELEFDCVNTDFNRWFSRSWSWKDLWTNWTDLTSKYDQLNTYKFTYKDAKNIWEWLNWEWRRYKLYLDSIAWIVLKHKWYPVAVISFSMTDRNTLFINQMQQVSYENYDRHWRCDWLRTQEIIKTIPWQKILYDILEKFALDTWIKTIVIQWWENNSWLKIPRTVVDLTIKWYDVQLQQAHLSKEIAHKIYDLFASTNGFEKSDGGNWEKSLLKI